MRDQHASSPGIARPTRVMGAICAAVATAAIWLVASTLQAPSTTVAYADDADAQAAAAAAAYTAAVPQASGTCATCHTDLAALQAAAPEGVDASLYLVDESFPTSLHGMLGCTYCHGGHADQADAAAAMAGMNAKPTSDGGVSVCGTCHEEIVANALTSLHYTTAGVWEAWSNRLAAYDETMGANLAAETYHHDGYQGACYDCHADCSKCHVVNAQTYIFGNEDNGFIKGHNFVDATSNDDITGTCLVCHAGSIATCYTQYDVHGNSGAGMGCMDCHEATDVHGDGIERTTMSHTGAVAVECEDCHSAEDLTGQWHEQTHLETIECWACHTSDYNTCYSCHGWMAGNREDAPFMAEDDCNLGYDVVNGKITTLVKAPVDGGMMGDANDLVIDDELLNNGSTWYIGFVHGVIVPEVTQEFCDRCHGEGTALLKEDQLQYPDYEAQQLVGELPEVDAAAYAQA